MYEISDKATQRTMQTRIIPLLPWQITASDVLEYKKSKLPRGH